MVELVDYVNDYSEFLGKFDTMAQAYDYILQFNHKFHYNLILEYKLLAQDQSKGSIVSIDNLKKPSKVLYLTSDLRKRRKLTI